MGGPSRKITVQSKQSKSGKYSFLVGVSPGLSRVFEFSEILPLLQGAMLSKSLEVYQVPIKVFLEDGIIKKTWVEGVDPQKHAEFKNWLSSL